MQYLRLVRWKNLLFVAIIQWLMQHSVVYPILQTFGFEVGTQNVFYLILIVATVMITAGGYVINDYFDVKIDRINSPERVIVGSTISLRASMLFYQILTGLGTILGLVLAFWVKSFSLGFIFLLTPGLLWFYSASYKRQFIIGNLIVSLASALSVLIVGVLAVALLKTAYNADLLNQTPVPMWIYAWTGGFAGFAFLLTWIREIIKDMEDEEGDREMECRTMPIKWGQKKTKFFLYGLILFSIATLLHVNYHYIPFEGNTTLKYIIFGLIIPLLVLGYLIFKSKNKSEYRQVQTLTKFIMLVGVLYSLIFYFLMSKTYGISLFGLFIVQ